MRSANLFKTWAVARAIFVFMASGTLFAMPTLTLAAAGATNAGCLAGGGTSFAGGVCTVAPGVGGVVQFRGVLGSWNIDVGATGETYPAIGSLADPQMELQGGGASSAANPGPLTIRFFEDGFTSFPVGLEATAGGTDKWTKSSFSVQSPGATNITGLAYTTPGSSTSGNVSFGYTSPTVSINPGGVYGLTLQAVISPDVALSGSNAKPQETFGFGLVAPEPSFYALAGVGLAGILAMARRKEKRRIAGGIMKE